MGTASPPPARILLSIRQSVSDRSIPRQGFPMSDAIASVLSQIRSLQSQVQPVLGGAGESAGAKAPGFSETLQNALKKVNDTQIASRQVAERFELGDPDTDLVKVMIASQQSQLALRATVEVRNRVVQAYQDVMNMPL
jgi:flagellar hook-basal body complex protein FliE